MAPSKLVGIGVHTIILDTAVYAELGEWLNGGVFLHHVPKTDTKHVGSVIKTAHIVAADGNGEFLGHRPHR
ncbi:hypothetical protein ABT147_39810 [Streptomyces sp. NPDC001868]|uniref:hypothetical protein n=1 Tax=Streptomyces sp. NPDC001868 TaxID=3154401 RepID=UPI003331C265